MRLTGVARALLTPFDWGTCFGNPDDPDTMHRVLLAALELLEQDAPGELVRFR